MIKLDTFMTSLEYIRVHIKKMPLNNGMFSDHDFSRKISTWNEKKCELIVMEI